jgi:uncharacterized protein (TIGR02301 family)
MVLLGAFLLAPFPASASQLNDGLMRLAEILGSVHHLRDVCGANDGLLWRNKMIDMMNVAKLDPKQRKAMISHFNDAFYDARTRFPHCTSDAAKRANSLFNEAHHLAERLANGGKGAASLF